MDAKRCSRCGKVKPLTDYFKSPSNRDGLTGQCKPCRAEKMREYNATPAGREKVRAKWTAQNRQRSERLAEERRQKGLPPRRVIPEPGTPEWEQRRSWSKRVTGARQQAKRFGCAVNDLTLQDWIDIVTAHRGECFYCQATGDMWVEHVRPLHQGYPNSKANVVPACESCNRHKARRSMEQFLADRCGRDHPMTPDNVYVYPDGKKRVCKTCRRESFRRHHEKRKQRKAAA